MKIKGIGKRIKRHGENNEIKPELLADNIGVGVRTLYKIYKSDNVDKLEYFKNIVNMLDLKEQTYNILEKESIEHIQVIGNNNINVTQTLNKTVDYKQRVKELESQLRDKEFIIKLLQKQLENYEK